METPNLVPEERLEFTDAQDLRTPWQSPVLETIESQRLVAVLASCQESAPSATNDPFCSADCP